jgi:hypothetical protein
MQKNLMKNRASRKDARSQNKKTSHPHHGGALFTSSLQNSSISFLSASCSGVNLKSILAQLSFEPGMKRSYFGNASIT